MAFHFLLIFSLLNLAFAGSHAALPEEVHWKSVFPNTPMPKALKDLLRPPGNENPSIDWTKHNSNADSVPRFRAYNYEQSGTEVEFSGDEVASKEFKGSSKESKSVNGGPINPFIIYENATPNKELKGKKSPFVKGNSNTDESNSVFKVSAYNYGSSSKELKSVDAPINPFIIYENTGTNREPPINRFKNYWEESKGKKSPLVKDNSNSNTDESNSVFKVGAYNYGSSSKELKSVDTPINPFIIYENAGTNREPPINRFKNYWEESKGNKNSLGRKHGNAAINETIYFFQEDLHPGKMVKLSLLIKTRDMTTFLPQGVAESIPFSTDKLPEILKHFSLEAESREANAMKQTIKGCEREIMRGEEMYCTTSFESFVDSSVSKLGKNIQLLANELGKETKNPVFTIGRGIQNMGEEELVCHKIKYPYAVFLCHSIDRTVVYKVPLVGIDWTKANGLAICHKDTSAWNPNHPAFLILKVKPGTVPICHFVVRDTVAWVRK